MQELPYRTFSAFLRERFGQRVQKITLDAGLGCPNRADGSGGCIYCNQQGSGTGALKRGAGLDEQIRVQMTAMQRRYGAGLFLAYFQSYTNTYGPPAELKKVYDQILPHDQIVGLAIGTRPDCIDRERLDLIASYGDRRLVWLEYGLQSANDKTLRAINRGHDVATFIRAVEMTAKYAMRICAHAIIGLPGEGPDDYLATARLLAKLPVTDVKLHLMYVVKGTPLEELYRAGRYQPLTMAEYAQAAAAFIACLRPDMIIQRLTGDPHAQELVAPLWALEKHQVRAKILAIMQNNNLKQGCRHATL